MPRSATRLIVGLALLGGTLATTAAPAVHAATAASPSLCCGLGPAGYSQFGYVWFAQGNGYTPSGLVRIEAWDARDGAAPATINDIMGDTTTAAPAWSVGSCGRYWPTICLVSNPSAGTINYTSTFNYLPPPCDSKYPDGANMQATDLSTGLKSNLWWQPPTGC
jgi:hypothetical protein